MLSEHGSMELSSDGVLETPDHHIQLRMTLLKVVLHDLSTSVRHVPLPWCEVVLMTTPVASEVEAALLSPFCFWPVACKSSPLHILIFVLRFALFVVITSTLWLIYLCECEDRGASLTLTTFVNFQILSTIIHRVSVINSWLIRRFYYQQLVDW